MLALDAMHRILWMTETIDNKYSADTCQPRPGHHALWITMDSFCMSFSDACLEADLRDKDGSITGTHMA